MGQAGEEKKLCAQLRAPILFGKFFAKYKSLQSDGFLGKTELIINSKTGIAFTKYKKYF